MKFEPIIQVPAGWTAIAGRLGVHVFEGHLPVADMDRMQEVGDRWFKAHPGKLVELVIVFPSDARMTSEERQRMTRLIKHWEAMRIASASVILATGLVGAMQRSILTGMMMLAPAPHPARVFSTISDAVTWLEPHIRSVSGQNTKASDVTRAIDEVCDAFRAREKSIPK